MKKFINRPENVVEEMLEGMAVLDAGLMRLAGHKVVMRADAAGMRDRQVALVSGGGSGHEPAHAGYVGAGMLSAAVAGEVFTSPSSDAVLAAIRAVAGKCGVLLIVKNYTGDRLNFGLAAEMARGEGIAVEMIVVDDDVAIEGGATGARGLAGTVLIHKVVGAAAAEGKGLLELVKIGRAAIGALGTMGVSFSAGISPAVGRPSFELGEGEMELGLGIHGEPGVKRMPLEAADALTETLLRTILDKKKDHPMRPAKPGNETGYALLINNLGATTGMEMAIVARHAMDFVSGKGVKIERILAGTFLSSLDMAGISISLLALTEEWLRWLDAPTSAPAWPNVRPHSPGKRGEDPPPKDYGMKSAASGSDVTARGREVKQAIEAACRALIAAEPELTELDRITGDGDLGASMERAAHAILKGTDFLPLNDASATLIALSDILRRELGGSSGPLYGVLFLRCGRVLKDAGSGGLEEWADALGQGCQAISDLGGAKPGDRTMLDTLDPFVARLRESNGSKAIKEVVIAAVEAGERGADATASMKPRLGRSSYLGERVLGHPDPGAKAVAMWLRAVCESLWGR
jgi:triose/dihydroxyacetone kinase / FAD-AMP lyase (cyclizing)